MAQRRRTPTEGEKQYLSGLQFGTCNNRPQSTDDSFHFFENGLRYKYSCPMWLLYGGRFDLSGYDADHIVELAEGGTNDTSNFQLLCKCCHSFKTKNYTRQPMPNGERVFSSAERGRGAAYMNEERRTQIPQMKINREDMDTHFGKKSNLKKDTLKGNRRYGEA